VEARRRHRWQVGATVALGLLPAAWVAVRLARGQLGANPIEAALNALGFWTLALLLASLAASPLHDLTGLAWPVRVRRALGLLAFGYAATHLAWYVAIDQFFDLALLWQDVVKRKFMAVGFAAFLLLLPLAVTSTDAWVRRLGFRRWKALHRLAYAAGVLGVVHFTWRVKADLTRPAIAAAVLALLLLARLPRLARARARG
jgi:sulfoxide reductase heme-binding subunit YedZ